MILFQSLMCLFFFPPPRHQQDGGKAWCVLTKKFPLQDFNISTAAGHTAPWLKELKPSDLIRG